MPDTLPILATLAASTLHPLVETIHHGVLAECSRLFFRQSFLQDYMTCPQLALYRWVLGLEEERSNFAGFLGTAGHEVIYDFHASRAADQGTLMDITTCTAKFQEAFWKTVKKEGKTPKIGAAFQSVEEQLNAETPYYADLLLGYQLHPKNQSFHSTMQEQSFVLSVDFPAPDGTPENYLFTGQLDQGGAYDDGSYGLRDIKFRDNQFRPSRNEIDLNVQMTIYAAAMKYGVPACRTCKPTYRDSTDPALGAAARELVYNGPCDACKALIGTYKWPQQFPEKCEMIWMYDFERHSKDQYDLEVMDKTKPKVKGPKGGLMYQRKPNPEYHQGYKAGDFKGACFIPTYRRPSQIDALMGDILKVCKSIRSGFFHRRPSKHCYFCSFAEPCRNALELKIKEANLTLMQTHGSDDPFGD